MSDEATLASGYGGAYEAGWQSGREDGRKEERARIRAEVQKTHDRWLKGYNDDSTPFTAGWITALRHVMYTIIDAGGEPHE